MAGPTRAEIEAVFATPKYKVEILNHAGVWYTIFNARVASISGSADSTGNQDNGVSFGTPANPSASVEMEEYLVDGLHEMRDPYWINKPVRISFGFAASDFIVVFQGPINSMSKKNEIISLSLGGNLDYLADVKIHTPIYYRKPAATKTTIATIEDPDNVSYVGGMINMALWRAGGRPYEQKGIVYTEASPDWKFWYSCEQSLIAPDFSWYSGDNTQDEVYAIARAVGGQLYQDTQGVVRYVQPLSFADTSGYSSYYTFTDSVFNGYSENISKGELVGTLKLLYTPRRVEVMQTVVEDKTPRVIQPLEQQVIELSPDKPIWQYQGLTAFSDTTAVNTMQAILLDNRAITPTIGVVEQYANKVLISVYNPDSTTPMIITSIKIEGRPLMANDDLIIQYPLPGDAFLPEKTVENNVYIQNEAHAKRLTRMIFDFYNELRPIISLDNVQYDPDRFVGEIVQIASTFNNNPAKYFRIIKLAHQNIGTTMSVDLVQITSIPKRSDMFIIGTSYASGDTRQLSY